MRCIYTCVTLVACFAIYLIATKGTVVSEDIAVALVMCANLTALGKGIPQVAQRLLCHLLNALGIAD